MPAPHLVLPFPSVLALLHWLPVKYIIHFTVSLFVYKALKSQVPEYIVDLLCSYNTSRTLRSSYQMLLPVPQTRLNGKG